MRARSLAIAALLVLLVFGMVSAAFGAPAHDKAVFAERFLTDGHGKQLDTKSSWNSGGYKWWGEIKFANSTSGAFTVYKVREHEAGGTESKKVGSGRAYVTGKTVTFKYKSTSSASLRKAIKNIKNGKKYYYRSTNVSDDSQGSLKLYKTKTDWSKRHIYKKFNFGAWG